MLASAMSGNPPPMIYTMLSATAIEHDLHLVARNLKDTKASGAMVFDPWNDDAQMFPLSPRTGHRL
jgi:predicted nucleic acid-binding protein